MYSWLDRADFVPRGNRLQRVDREAYCDGVMHWTPSSHVLSRPRVRSARMSRKTASVAATGGRPALVHFVASFRAASGVDGTDPYRLIKCVPKPRRDSRISSFPRKMTDAQAAELY